MLKKIKLIVLGGLVLTVINGCAAVAIGAVAVAGGTAAYVATDPRKTGTVVDDNTIAMKVSGKIADDYPNANIYVSCYNGVVLLTGQVANDKTKEGAFFTAKTVPGVRQIYNYVDIRLAQSITSRTEDSYTTTQVKSKLIGLENVNSNDIKVVTTNSVVYLLGVVNKKQAHAAAKAAANTGGVKKVITLFEYTS
jgi:osmotically-inducible protein OsmY